MAPKLLMRLPSAAMRGAPDDDEFRDFTPRHDGSAAPPGVTKEVLKAGDGKTFPNKGDLLCVHYTGILASTGKKFDSSLKEGPGQPLHFEVGAGKVIKGWDEALLGMSLGEKSKLLISSDLAYGASGCEEEGVVIPPNSDLVFTVQLLGME
eukprot:TRINITY_DN21352_c0_g3_i1.p1 TRINITY_DN21352_c0_g3~~TRINITY_DN21352_c0_g3_i1.p1  ORF type:complete len:151 (+),score=29.41 TRINITY_DN21352_c0_g3_i1:65-517(+)